MSKPIAICFAGAMGCGKTPIANHLSWNLGIPRFERDTIRNEIKESFAALGVTDSWRDEFDVVASERQHQLLAMKQNIILDASIDRTWTNKEATFTKDLLMQYGYDFILISFDLSREFLESLHIATKYNDLDSLHRTFADHNTFLSKSASDVSLQIADENYAQRIELCLEHVAAKIAANQLAGAA